MNILMITENDPAGMGIAFTNAINRQTDHRCRLITTKTRYNFNFEKDLHLPNLDETGFEEIVHLLKGADIIHFHLLADESIPLGPIKVSDYIRGKTIVHHHHGHPHFRSHPEIYREKYRRLGRRTLVSTPDLLRLLPEATWQPNLVPVHEPLFLPQSAPLNGRFVVGQSATRKDLKNTQELLAAVEKIKQRFTNPEVLANIIEHTDYRECLKRKRECHAIFDHMQGYYGVSSLESLSQGKPVIAGLDDWNIRCIKEFTGNSQLPWVIARTEEELLQAIDTLVTDANQRQQIGIASRQFMEQSWSEQKVLQRLFDIYASLD